MVDFSGRVRGGRLFSIAPATLSQAPVCYPGVDDLVVQRCSSDGNKSQIQKREKLFVTHVQKRDSPRKEDTEDLLKPVPSSHVCTSGVENNGHRLAFHAKGDAGRMLRDPSWPVSTGNLGFPKNDPPPRGGPSGQGESPGEVHA